MPASFSSESISHDQLIAGNAHLLLTRPVTLASGQNLARGAVLGKVTASGKYVLSASAAVDGSQTPDLVLAEATDASAGDKATVAYEAGYFNQNALIFGAGHDADGVRETLRGKGIRLVKPLTA